MSMVKRNRILAFLVTFCMLLTLIPAAAFAADETGGLPESEHPYTNDYDNTWTYTADDAVNGVYLTFDESTETESGYDFIYVIDGNDVEIGKYSGTELSGKTVYVPTATVKIRLTSDQSGTANGFKVTAIEAADSTIDLEKVGTVDAISPVMLGETPNPIVRANGVELTKDTDYTVTFSDNEAVGTATATITGTGKYSGTLTAQFDVFDDNNKVTSGVSVSDSNISLRQTADWNDSLTSYSGASGYIPLEGEGLTTAYLNAIESVTLKPVDNDGSDTSTGELTYPNAPKEITLAKQDLGTWDNKDGKWFVNGDNNRIYFYRTSEEPVVYVMEGHEPVEITGRWSTVTYPQSQTYEVTVTARGYEDVTGEVTYYTGTSPDFSIIEDRDGNDETTDDQNVLASWTSDEIKAMSTFANGSSQCGMTGFRTFSGMGVSLKDLLKDAKVTVSEDDYFLLDTSDHYGNNFTYEELFDTTRYFLESVYDDPEVAETYHRLVDSDDQAGATVELRRLLAEKALEDDSTIEPRISYSYNETMLSGEEVGKATLPTKENTSYSELISYENQYRFFYGIALEQEDVTVTFDSQGGSDVDPQLVKSHFMTSTSNTTIKSSYWANSLVIYRGTADEYKAEEGITEEPSTAADKIVEPEAPTRDGYVFGGWYTDAGCTEPFDFTADGGTVDQDTTLYAEWISEDVEIDEGDITAEADTTEGVAIDGASIESTLVQTVEDVISSGSDTRLRAGILRTLNDGGTVVAELTVEPADDEEVFNNSFDNVLKMLDINITVKADGGNVLGRITETNSPIGFTVELENAREGQAVSVAREHDGVIEKIGDSNVTDGKVDFSTAKFSLFAIGDGYREAAVDPSNPQGNGDVGDGNGTGAEQTAQTSQTGDPFVAYLPAVIALAIISLAVAGIAVKWRKREE